MKEKKPTVGDVFDEVAPKIQALHEEDRKRQIVAKAIRTLWQASLEDSNLSPAQTLDRTAVYGERQIKSLLEDVEGAMRYLQAILDEAEARKRPRLVPGV